MKPDHYRWQDFVIPPRRSAVDFVATLLVIALTVSAVVTTGTSKVVGPPATKTAEANAPWAAAPPLAQSVKRPVTPLITASCL
ncbi:hypothetical protein SAMN02745126_00860 [Enhydrobacter aerosaccus]|uniref:Uncharacterized protein n=2 Tax=Enhydrobacter aerosaccus TaxID=225324 RepID=A0A1T4KB31_9HYPH|nr:hypothetical protein SAMN02745126_00860 [Enhydrobacter aerosaccus]